MAMMEAVPIFETLVNINFSTRQYIQEEFKLHTRPRENLKSHVFIFLRLYFCCSWL
jgi:hypothetical protein